MHHNHSSLQKNAVLATLAYHDIFDYPLSLDEIKKYCIAHEYIPQTEIHQKLKDQHIGEKLGWYFLKGREEIVDIRLGRQKASAKKLQKARRIAKMLSHLSTILYIGVSGSLALKNASEEDDIDFFIVTKPNTLWITRLVVTFILLKNGYLRTYSKKNVKDKICTNMWIDMDHLAFPEKRQNVYTAHEITQLYSLYNKGNTYQQFLISNMWINEFLPNIKILRRRFKKKNTSLMLRVLNAFAQDMQLWYMRSHRTSEVIQDGFVAFHPKDYTEVIVQTWDKRLKRYGI